MTPLEKEIQKMRALADMMQHQATLVEKYAIGEKKPRKKRSVLSEQEILAIRAKVRRNMPPKTI